MKKLLLYSKKLKGGIFSLIYIMFIKYCKQHNIHLKDKEVSFYLKQYKHKFIIRTNTSDVLILWALCLAGEYDIEWNEKFTPKLIVDAGANVGFFSLIIASYFPDAKIIAIEPDEKNYELLCKNVEDMKNVVPVLSGVWNADVCLKVHSENESYGITVEESEDGEGIMAIGVNTLLKQYGLSGADDEIIDIFKMDIEGSEYPVFSKNYEKWISRVKCYIIELHEYFHKGCDELINQRLVIENGYHRKEHMEDTIFYQDGVLKE